MDIHFPGLSLPEGCTEFGIGTLRKISLLYLREALLKLTIACIKNDNSKDGGKAFRSGHELPDHSSFKTQEVVLHLESLVSKLFPTSPCKTKEESTPVTPAAAVASTAAATATTTAAPTETLASSSSVSADSNSVDASGFESICAGFTSVVKVLVEARDIASLIGAAQQVHLLKDEYIKLLTGESPVHKPEGFFKYSSRSDRLAVTWDTKFGGEFMIAVVRLLQYQREEQRRLSLMESLIVHLAYVMLMEGSIPRYQRSRFLGTSGFRHFTQTYMSLTDPGDGHILGTTMKSAWMQGVIVHVEHLERPKHLPRDQIESYRVPSILDFAKVRIHVGPAAPTTYFVGRMVKDGGNFEMDFLKAVHLTAAAIAAAFVHGAAECKVAMDGLTAKQAIRYMRALVAHVMRKRRQYLSCAFNINTPLTDDLSSGAGGVARLITDRTQIADLAITLACEGGFDKVTWDGASDVYPSTCILRQLSFPAALRLVHEAHKSGLLTYFSAGFKFDHIENAVYTGVDGVGIGGAQVLRYMDHETGMHGPYQEENIDRILSERDKAANALRGRGVALLCRLDRMLYEGSISEDEALHAEQLFHALASLDPSQPPQDDTHRANVERAAELKTDSGKTSAPAYASANNPGSSSAVIMIDPQEAAEIDRLMKENMALAARALDTNRQIVLDKLDLLRRIVELPDDGEMPMLGLANRLLGSRAPILAKCASSMQQWDEWIEKLRVMASFGDDREGAVTEEYFAFPWTEFRRVHREPVVHKGRARSSSSLMQTK